MPDENSTIQINSMNLGDQDLESKITYTLSEINITTSVARKVPLEQYGSVDFFSSMSSRVSLNGTEGKTIEEVIEDSAPIRRKLVNNSFSNCLRDVALEVLITRAIRDGLTPEQAVEHANKITTFSNVLDVIAQGK